MNKVISYAVEKVEGNTVWEGWSEEYWTVLTCENGMKYQYRDPWPFQFCADVVGVEFLGTEEKSLVDSGKFGCAFTPKHLR